ncbi:NTF2-like protein [Saccharata proteae CBS 121410]|uniref:NTF2-like protein n=1 Tax=Saccharata proteae CBS 121410 TaxID=1314787 RepID=A0A9P4HPQ8_9PEZI|nr:NTF2-like protein [Saccharata proteae CBS 121410]
MTHDLVPEEEGSSNRYPTTYTIDPDHKCVIQTPLSRRGVGPLLIILVENYQHNNLLPEEPPDPKKLDPLPLKKWAEEGYLVAQFVVNRNPADPVFDTFMSNFLWACDNLKIRPDCDQTSGKIGVISIEMHDCIGAIVCYGQDVRLEKPIPQIVHIPDEEMAYLSKPAHPEATKVHTYANAKYGFALPNDRNYRSSHAAIAHTRTLSFLKPLLGGPYFDLEAIWEEHAKYEFEDRSVPKTMATMVDEPYVNHIPTMTGGIGRANLTRFYSDHFIHNNPPDAGLQLVSRTVGIDRVIDEFVFECTHTKTIDWLIPGIPPTNKPLRIPFASVVNIRGDKLCHEHIAWDQATVLVQLGLMPEYLPFPYPINNRHPAPGKKFVYKVPAAGVSTAEKLIDENAVESNEMLDFEILEVDA